MKTTDGKMPAGYSDFIGARLQLAREFRDLTQKELARSVAVDQSMISLVEIGTKQPSSELVAALANYLGFATGFFHLNIPDPFIDHQCHFRHRRDTPEHLKKRVRAHASLLAMVVNELRGKFRFPAYNVPEINARTYADIERAANKCRLHWGLPLDRPIRHIGRAIEHAGVMIMSHVGETKKIDAFSRFGHFSMIFLNLAKQSTSRRYFDVAHEVGHLVLHRSRATGDTITEHEANRFAGAFLLPYEAFAKDFSSDRSTLSHIVMLKRKWAVSGKAILKRAFELDLIQADRYRTLQKQIAIQWRSGEPCEPDFAGGEIFKAALTRLCLKRADAFGELSHRLQIDPAALKEITGFDPAELQNVLPFDHALR